MDNSQSDIGFVQIKKFLKQEHLILIFIKDDKVYSPIK